MAESDGDRDKKEALEASDEEVGVSTRALQTCRVVNNISIYLYTHQCPFPSRSTTPISVSRQYGDIATEGVFGRRVPVRDELDTVPTFEYRVEHTPTYVDQVVKS